jgi:glycosyltransferase involved in cell wall biosynthesis
MKSDQSHFNIPTGPSLKVLRSLYKNSRTFTDKIHVLNAIGFVYLEQNKPFLSYLCFSESLLRNHDQETVASLVSELKPSTIMSETFEFRPPKYKVSVMVPTSNRDHELLECINSIMGQTYKNYEIIVINDAGDEKAKNVVDSFNCSNIKYKRLPIKSGPSVARNEGIRISEGEYIAFLDDDDVYYENHLMTLVSFLEKHADYGVAYTNAYRVQGTIEGNKFITKSRSVYTMQPKEGFDKNRLLNANFISTLNIMLRRSCISEVGFFNDQITKFEDWDFLLRLALRYNFKQLNEITGEYRFKENNSTIIENDEMKFWLQVIQNYHIYFHGNIALARHYAGAKDKTRMLQCMREIQDDYLTYFKHPDSLYVLTSFLSFFSDDKIKKMITTDLLQLSLKKFIYGCVSPGVLLSSRQLCSHVLKGMFGRLLHKYLFN